MRFLPIFVPPHQHDIHFTERWVPPLWIGTTLSQQMFRLWHTVVIIVPSGANQNAAWSVRRGPLSRAAISLRDRASSLGAVFKDATTATLTRPIRDRARKEELQSANP
jgi:hypothetical protein